MEHEKSNIYSNLSWTGIKPLKFHHREVLNNIIYKNNECLYFLRKYI